MLIGRHLTGLHTSVRAIENNFGRWATAIGGVTLALGGVGLLGAMKKLVETTKDYSDQLVKIERLGGGMGDMVRNGSFEKQAFSIAKKTGMNVVDVMKIPGSTYSILGADPSMAMWETLAKYSFIQKMSHDGNGNSKDDLNKLMRSSELSGRLTDPETGHASEEKLIKFLDMMNKISAATHGTVNADTMLGMAKQGGFTLRGLSDEGFMNMAMMAQAMGGNRAGTALLSTWGQLSSGTMMKRSAEGLRDLGLLGEEGTDWKVGKGGHVTISDEASKRLSATINKDPMKLAEMVKESLAAKGITDPEEQMRLIMKAMARQTTQRFLAEEVMNFGQMGEERKRILGGAGNEDSFKLYTDKSVAANIEAMHNAWSNLMYAIAGPNSMASIEIMKTITNRLNQLTDYMRTVDPETISSVAKAVGALAIGMIALGGVAIAVVAGIPGLLLAGVAALAGYAAIEWDKFKAGYQVLQDAANAFQASMQQMAKAVWDFIKSIPGTLAKPFINPGNTPPVDDPSGAGAFKEKMKFNPGDIKMKAAPITLALNVDGRALAQTVSQEIDYLHEHPTSAPSYDTARRFGPADGNIIAG